MRRRIITTAMLLSPLLALLAPSSSLVSAQDLDCGDFSSQSDAQAYFDGGGGSPAYNYNGLDGDGNGLACDGYDYGSSQLPPVIIPSTEVPTDVPVEIPTATLAPTEESAPTDTPTTEPSSASSVTPTPSSSVLIPSNPTVPVAIANGPSTTTRPTATSRPNGQSRAARTASTGSGTDRTDPDYYLGRMDGLLTLDIGAGDVLRDGMTDPQFTDAAWSVANSSAVGLILSVDAQIQSADRPTDELQAIDRLVRDASDVVASAAATCDAALVSGDQDDADQCLTEIDDATAQLVTLRDNLQTWDGGELG